MSQRFEQRVDKALSILVVVAISTILLALITYGVGHLVGVL